jgi:anthranilate synthase component 2
LKKILLVDNFDSFTYNLLHSIEKNDNVFVTVIRNDQLLELDIAIFDKIVLSPGPGLPEQAGQLIPFIEHCYTKKPILGICLGHQALGQFFGAQLKNLPHVLHGVQLETKIISQKSIFKLLPQNIQTGHYHSWVLNEEDFPSSLEITAHNKQGGIMSFVHKQYDITGIQFHPESVLTPMGDFIISRWINY